MGKYRLIFIAAVLLFGVTGLALAAAGDPGPPATAGPDADMSPAMASTEQYHGSTGGTDDTSVAGNQDDDDAAQAQYGEGDDESVEDGTSMDDDSRTGMADDETSMDGPSHEDPAPASPMTPPTSHDGDSVSAASTSGHGDRADAGGSRSSDMDDGS